MVKARHMAVLRQHMAFEDFNNYENPDHQDNRCGNSRQIGALKIVVILVGNLFQNHNLLSGCNPPTKRAS